MLWELGVLSNPFQQSAIPSDAASQPKASDQEPSCTRSSCGSSLLVPLHVYCASCRLHLLKTYYGHAFWNFQNAPSVAAAAAAAYKSLQSCPTLCDPRDGSLPGYAIPGILQARTLEWVAISFSNAWKVNSESEVTQSCPTLCNPIDSSLSGSSVHGIFQARVLEWVAIAFSNVLCI